jgi:hypothetical protein
MCVVFFFCMIYLGMLYKTIIFLKKLASFQIMVSLKSHECWALLWFQEDILFLYT